MVSSHSVEQQLKQIGCNYTAWGSTEAAQLPRLLMDGEQIYLAINGYYEGGFGMLVVTNIRVLIVDKKPFVLNIEDLRYDMITEVNYGARLVIATMNIALPTRTIYFSSWRMDKLQRSMEYVQEHVMRAKSAPTNTSANPQNAQPSAQTQLPTDWFQNQSHHTLKPAHAIHPVLRLARSAMTAAGAAEEPFMQLGRRSSQRGINPYAVAAFARRRRLPAFYTPS